MPLTNTVEHHESSSSSHQTAVNGRWSDPKTTHSSSSNVTRSGDATGGIIPPPALGYNNTNNTTSRNSSRYGGGSSPIPPPPPLSTSSGAAMEDMERRSREVEQGFWERVNESRARMGFPTDTTTTVGGGATRPFTSTLNTTAAPLLRSSPTPGGGSSYRSTSAASHSSNNNNNFSSARPFENIGNNNALIAFPDNLDDMTKHSRDLAVQGIDSSIEDMSNGLKLMRWSFDVQGFEPNEIHVKTVGDEQLEIHGKHEEKSGTYSNYSEFSKSVSLPPQTRFDEMRSVFDTRTQRLTVEAPFKPLRQAITSTTNIDYTPKPITGSHYDSGYSNGGTANRYSTPPPTTNYTTNNKYSGSNYSNIPIGLSSKQRESYRSTASSNSSSNSSSRNNYSNYFNTNVRGNTGNTGAGSPYVNTGAIERSSSAHGSGGNGGGNGGARGTSRSPMGVRFEDEAEQRYSSNNNSGGYNATRNNQATTIPVRYSDNYVNNVNNANTYSKTRSAQPSYIGPYNESKPELKTTTEYSRRITESTMNETRPAGTHAARQQNNIDYQRPLSYDRNNVRVESVVGE